MVELHRRHRERHVEILGFPKLRFRMNVTSLLTIFGTWSKQAATNRRWWRPSIAVTVFDASNPSSICCHHISQLEMWANAQRDGRPAEYRWCHLFNTAKFGWRPLLECRAVTLPRRETRGNLQGCLKLANGSQPLVSRSAAYSEDMWGRHCSLTLFPIVDMCLSCEELRRYSPTKLCYGAQMAIFRSCVFSEPRAAHFRPTF